MLYFLFWATAEHLFSTHDYQNKNLFLINMIIKCIQVVLLTRKITYDMSFLPLEGSKSEQWQWQGVRGAVYLIKKQLFLNISMQNSTWYTFDDRKVRLCRDKTENRSASCVATSGIIQVKTIKKGLLHDEIIVTSFTFTRRASSPLAFPIKEEHTGSSAGNC